MLTVRKFDFEFPLVVPWGKKSLWKLTASSVSQVSQSVDYIPTCVLAVRGQKATKVNHKSIFFECSRQRFFVFDFLKMLLLSGMKNNNFIKKKTFGRGFTYKFNQMPPTPGVRAHTNSLVIGLTGRIVSEKMALNQI